MLTELDDLQRPPALPPGTVAFVREARLFATHRALADRLHAQRVVVRLVPDELLHPAPPCDLIVRRGNLRVSELLDDGREVTRAVLQAGAVLRVREGAGDRHGEAGSSPLYTLARTALMALGETELWQLPSGVLNDI